MSKLENIGYSLKDVTIIPSRVSRVRHRGDVNPFIEICNRQVYPIFVAPMAAVTDEQNYKAWIENKVTPVIPRSIMERVSLEERLNLAEETFVSLSLTEAEEFADYEIPSEFNKKYICIDLANGHMQAVLDICRKIKDIYGDKVELMTGNIANPKVYEDMYKAGISWIRTGIGNGSRCTSSNSLGVHYPFASLIDALSDEKKRVWLECGVKDYNDLPKIVADGGIGWYDDINKAIALGADAVMIGKLFAECEEACGKILYARNETDFKNDIGFMESDLSNLLPSQRKWLKPYRNYAGMSHRSMQKITGGDGSKVSEGIVKPVIVKHTVAHFMENVDAYLRSAMSYCGSFSISSFKSCAQMMIFGGSGRSVYDK